MVSKFWLWPNLTGHHLILSTPRFLYSGCLPHSYGLDIKKLNFYNGVQSLRNSMPMQLIVTGSRDEFTALEITYKLLPYHRGFLIKSKVFDCFKSQLSNRTIEQARRATWYFYNERSRRPSNYQWSLVSYCRITQINFRRSSKTRMK